MLKHCCITHHNQPATHFLFYSVKPALFRLVVDVFSFSAFIGALLHFTAHYCHQLWLCIMRVCPWECAEKTMKCCSVTPLVIKN